MSTVLLLHGLTGLPSEVEPIRAALIKNGDRVYAPVLPGHGTTVETLAQTERTEFLNWAEETFLRIAEESRGPVALVGLSFGGILSVYLATKYPALVSKLCVMSGSFRLRSTFREYIFQALSILPECILKRLPTVEKDEKVTSDYVWTKEGYKQHSLGAVARLVRIRREVFREISALTMPILLIQDPEDHHLAANAAQIAASRAKVDVKIEWIKGGTHALPIGPEWKRVVDLVLGFIADAS